MTKKKDSTQAFDPSGPAGAYSGIFGLPNDPETSLVHLVPVPYEATTSYRGGTSRGPRAILEASRQVDLFDLDYGRPYERGIYLHKAPVGIKQLNHEAKRAAAKVIRAGGHVQDSKSLIRALEFVNSAGAEVNRLVQETCAPLLDKGRVVGVVGGDHSTPFGLIEDITRRHPGVGILHIDAHHDLRVAYEGFIWSHASIMYNVMSRLPGVSKLVQVGIRDFSEEEHRMAADSAGRIVTFYDADAARHVHRGGTDLSWFEQIIEALPAEVYVSFDIDGLDPRFCPNTGTPVPGGLDFNQATHLLALVAESGRRVVGFDLNEIAPGPDEWDANVGARILYKLIGCALSNR